MPKKKTQEQFLIEAKNVHGESFDYSLVEYKNSRTKVKIICHEHGVFEQTPNKHLFGQSCIKCGYIKAKKLITLTNEKFINKSIKVHGDKYDYSLVEYINTNSKVKIICHKHGVFEQVASYHTSGNGCQKCIKNIPLNRDRFIEKAKDIHGDKYDYSSVVFKNNKTKVSIICPHHGIFEQKPESHTNSKQGCYECGVLKSRFTQDEFIEKARIIHGDEYDYSLVEYVNARNSVKIICNEHGVFEQNARTHIKGVGAGCPTCSASKGEKIIYKVLKKHDLVILRQKSFKKCVYKSKLKFDFYLPEYDVCIEYDGKQHFKPISVWGGDDGLIERQKRDQIKNEYCLANNIRLYRIRYDEDINSKMGEIISNL